MNIIDSVISVNSCIVYSCCLRPRPHVSGDFCIHKFFYADTPSVHTCPPYTLGVSGDFCIPSPEWKFLYTLCIRIRVDARIRIFLYTLTSQYQNQSFFRARFSKMAASRNVVCSMLLGLLSSLIACLELNVAMLNLNFNYLRKRLSIIKRVLALCGF